MRMRVDSRRTTQSRSPIAAAPERARLVVSGASRCHTWHRTSNLHRGRSKTMSEAVSLAEDEASTRQIQRLRREEKSDSDRVGNANRKGETRRAHARKRAQLMTPVLLRLRQLCTAPEIPPCMVQIPVTQLPCLGAHSLRLYRTSRTRLPP